MGAAGGRAAIAGALDDSQPTRYALGVLLKILKDRNIPIDGYSSTDGLWVDSDDRWVTVRRGAP